MDDLSYSSLLCMFFACLVLTFVLARVAPAVGLFETFNVLMACVAVAPLALDKSLQVSTGRVHQI